jgi:serine O-acetyltransferase
MDKTNSLLFLSFADRQWISSYFNLSCLQQSKAKERFALYYTILYYTILYYTHNHFTHKKGIDLPVVGTKIGYGLYFPHPFCIVINQKAKIGNNCTIFQGVTIGTVRGKGVPVIGNNVVIAAGAKIVGKVNIGNNVMVGANAVVTKDIPDNATVVGIPARIVNYNGEANTAKVRLRM